jgi:hypothetical protein
LVGGDLVVLYACFVFSAHDLSLPILCGLELLLLQVFGSIGKAFSFELCD